MRHTAKPLPLRPSARLALVAAAASTVGACAWHDPVRVEEDFGQSVRQMVREQIHDPEAAFNPAELAPDTLGGAEAALGVDGYLEAARQARRPDRPIVPLGGRADAPE